jgi:hypothetical protein
MRAPLADSTLRVAPFRNGRPLAAMWRIWVQGRELYAVRRLPGRPVAKVSIHFSGQAHVALDADKRFQLTPPPPRASSPDWLWPLEWRFLLPSDTLLPPDLPLTRNQAAVGPQVPEGSNLLLNLLIAAHPCTEAPPIPGELTGTLIWEASLVGGYPVVMIAGGVPMTPGHEQDIETLRAEMPEPFRATGPLIDPYVELMRLHPAPDGNILTILPCGPDAMVAD